MVDLINNCLITFNNMDLNNIYKKNDIPLPENLKKFEEKDI